jgi:hypothetical protein
MFAIFNNTSTYDLETGFMYRGNRCIQIKKNHAKLQQVTDEL